MTLLCLIQVILSLSFTNTVEPWLKSMLLLKPLFTSPIPFRLDDGTLLGLQCGLRCTAGALKLDLGYIKVRLYTTFLGEEAKRKTLDPQ